MRRKMAVVVAVGMFSVLGASPAFAAPPSGDGQNNPKCSGVWDQATKTCTIVETYNNGNTKVKGQIYTKDGDPSPECKVNPQGKQVCN